MGSSGSHSQVKDNIVDLIIIIHRHSYDGLFGLDNGVSVAFYGGDIVLDGVTIKSGFPGSGMTLDSGLNGMRTDWYAHELGHKFFGSGHPQYNKDVNYGRKNESFWGLLIGTGYITNAHDRERLNWIDYNDVTEFGEPFIVSDFVTTGDAYRILIPGTTEAFLIENHQEISVFDRPTAPNSVSGKGLYIYHVKSVGVSQPLYDLESADGRYNWSNPYWIPNPWGTNTIPLFEKGTANPNGYDGMDALLTTIGTKYKNFVELIDGQEVQNRRVFGTGLDPYDVGYNQVFTRWSNPNSKTWDDISPTGISIEIISKSTTSNGEVYTIKVYDDDGEEAAPSKPQNLQVANVNNGVLLTWAANSEPDLAGYEVYRKVNSGSIQKISGSNLVTTNSYFMCGIGVVNNGMAEYSFYVKAVDTSNKKSTLSVPITIEVEYFACTDFSKVTAEKPAVTGAIKTYSLTQNYPNPFNPTTTITFALPNDSPVRLTVFDSNGRQIAELVNKQLSAGSYKIPFDASALSSGVYFYRLTAGNFHQTNKMMLLK